MSSSTAPNRRVQHNRPNPNSKGSGPCKEVGEGHAHDDQQLSWTSFGSWPSLGQDAVGASAPLFADSAAAAVDAPDNDMVGPGGDSFTSEEGDCSPPSILRAHAPGTRQLAFLNLAITYLTPWLKTLADVLAVNHHPRFRPVHEARALRNFERGCWVFSLSRSVFSDECLRQLWAYLRGFVEEGRAGLDVSVVLDTHGHDFLGTGQSGGNGNDDVDVTIIGDDGGDGASGDCSGGASSSSATISPTAGIRVSKAIGSAAIAKRIQATEQRHHLQPGQALDPFTSVETRASLTTTTTTSSSSSSSSFSSSARRTPATTSNPRPKNSNGKERMDKASNNDEEADKGDTEWQEDAQSLELRIYCYGGVARYIYGVVWLASDRRIKQKHAGWQDGRSHCGIWVDARSRTVLRM